MKKGMILSAALSVVGLMLVSCSSEPEATTTTTRQTTVTTAAPPPPAARTTTTTTHMGGGYWLPKPVAVASVIGTALCAVSAFQKQHWIRPATSRWLRSRMALRIF